MLVGSSRSKEQENFTEKAAIRLLFMKFEVNQLILDHFDCFSLSYLVTSIFLFFNISSVSCVETSIFLFIDHFQTSSLQIFCSLIIHCFDSLQFFHYCIMFMSTGIE